MKFPKRKLLRLEGYDYSSAGAYFVTICVQDRKCIFGEVVNGYVELNLIGKMVFNEWYEMMKRFPSIDLDKFIVMPNHIHGIIIINNPVGAPLVGDCDHVDGRNTTDVRDIVGAKNKRAGTSPAHTLGDIIGAFKSMTTVEYIRGIKCHQWPKINYRLWQRNYYERIIRHDDEMERIRYYIQNNPSNWADDSESIEK